MLINLPNLKAVTILNDSFLFIVIGCLENTVQYDGAVIYHDIHFGTRIDVSSLFGWMEW